jgi:hypothetical protein
MATGTQASDRLNTFAVRQWPLPASGFGSMFGAPRGVDINKRLLADDDRATAGLRDASEVVRRRGRRRMCQSRLETRILRMRRQQSVRLLNSHSTT